MHTGVPLFATWKTFLKKLSCTVCILSICFLVSPIQLSQFERILDYIFDFNCSTDAFATLCPSSAGGFIVSMIISALSIADGIIPSGGCCNASFTPVFMDLITEIFLRFGVLHHYGISFYVL